jgi:hypothetical protein
MTPDLIDQAIIASCKPQFLKVARIIHDVAAALKLPLRMEGLFVDEPEDFKRPEAQEVDVIAERIKALVARGLLDSQGNLDQWRYSEICLAKKNGT